MKYIFFKSVSFKLIVLVFVVLISLVSSSFLFNGQIDKLKQRIDNIYFGNFIPVIKLDLILDNYKEILTCNENKIDNKKCNFNKNRKIILKEWNYYSLSYKTLKERTVVSNIDLNIKSSFKKKKYKGIIKDIEFLINHELESAFKQRKIFLIEYKQMKDFLFYNMILILVLSLLLIAYIIYEVVKKDNQLRILNTKYKIDSITDTMTQLYNRNYFDTIFDSMPFISNENKWHSAFIMFDIDFFKQYNDTYGHDAGDETLRKVSNLLKQYFNKRYEYVFRLGGEEFGVILFDTDKEILVKCLDDINKKVVDLQIEHKGSTVLDVVSISIGAILYEPNSYISANKLYKSADECLYKSKNNGRNQYHINKGQ